jgi:hypothetical protein
MTEVEKLFEQLTRKAYKAACAGQWSDVIQLYAQRAQAGFPGDLSPDVAKQFTQYDQWMITRIQEVQALTQQQIGEVQDHRRKLETFKRQWSTHAPDQARHRLSI